MEPSKVNSHHHICSSLTYFTTYHQINHISIKLTNGNQVIVNYSGSVFLNQNHVINNVLYIPCFTFNLLSVAKLIDKLSCVLTFDSNGCHIQDKNSLKMIGSAKMHFIYSGSHLTKSSKSNPSNLHTPSILLMSVLVI